MEESIHIAITDIERRIMVRALNELREEQILNGKYHDSIDDLLLKICDAKAQKSKHKNYEER